MKRNYWPLLFIGIFSFTLGMIIWTIYNSVQVPVNEDKSFLNTYQKVDDSFNDMAFANKQFLQKYDFVLRVNDQEFDLSYKDIFYSQRVIEKRTTFKDVLNTGMNDIAVVVKEKETNKVLEKIVVSLRVTRATNNKSDIDLELSANPQGEYVGQFDLNLKGNWNITGIVSVGENKGYFYLKTNAI